MGRGGEGETRGQGDGETRGQGKQILNTNYQLPITYYLSPIPYFAAINISLLVISNCFAVSKKNATFSSGVVGKTPCPKLRM